MSKDEAPSDEALERHPSLDDRFDPAVRIVDYDPGWPTLADAELHRIKEALGDVAVRVEHMAPRPSRVSRPSPSSTFSSPSIPSSRDSATSSRWRDWVPVRPGTGVA